MTTDLEPEALEKAFAAADKATPVCRAFAPSVSAGIRAYLEHRRAALTAETRECVENMRRLGNALYNMSQMSPYSDEDRKHFAKFWPARDTAARLLEQAALLAQPPATQEQE